MNDFAESTVKGIIPVLSPFVCSDEKHWSVNVRAMIPDGRLACCWNSSVLLHSEQENSGNVII